ncbi:MAG: isopeptide-forming domain-containing fimbrial protein [Bacilli bacterium]|nr:isopeptide-forming domain-containing fimbrial protein [Bacilli bacterium]
MKKTIKFLTIATIILAMIVAIAPCNVLAGTVTLTTGTITVNTTDDSVRSVTLYKLFNIDSYTDDEDYSYSFANEDVKNYFSSKSYTNIVDALDYINTLNGNDVELNKFALDIKAAGIPGTTQNTTTDFTNQTSGYYLLVDNTTEAPDNSTISAVILNNVLFTAETTEYEVTLKVDEITPPEKTVADNDNNSSAEEFDSALPGEEVTYRIKQTIPEVNSAFTKYKMSIVDTLTGLIYDASNANISVKVDGTDYTASYPVSVNGNVLTWEFIFDENQPITFEEFKALAGKDIVIEYTVTVSEDAYQEVNTNEVVTKYSTNPNGNEEGTTEPDVVEVYCYTLTLNKVNSNEELLPGAVFTLTYPDGITTKNVEVGEDGTITLTGLKEGEYTLRETTAPEGYTLLDCDLTFKISDKASTNANATIESTTTGKEAKFINVEFLGATETTETDGEGNTITTRTAMFEVDVVNVKEGALPETGGMGTVIFTVVGITVMAVAGGLLVFRNRKMNN